MNTHDPELARRRADRYIARDGGEPCSLPDLRDTRCAQADALAKSIHQGIGGRIKPNHRAGLRCTGRIEAHGGG